MSHMDFAVAKGGEALCRICWEEDIFSPAAKALERYLKAVTGAASFFGEAPGTIAFKKEDRGVSGFSYRMEGADYVIGAQTAETAQYAVYDLLERLCGCRFYTSKAEKVPFNPDLTLCGKGYTGDPPIGFREVFYRDYEDPVFALKRKVSPSGKHSGWGFWCHSFQTLLPKEEYFDSHPEYFSLVDGKRIPNGQLCLSNPEVLEIVCENLKKYMDAEPDKLYWSVSQNDNDLHCQCPACRALDERDQTPMGSILTFVNKVAERFPDKMISTLAYWYSRKPPKYTRPAKNVHIMLCNIEAYRGEPLTEDPLNAGSVEELTQWAEICGNVFLWDYNIQFANLVSPFPNLNTLGPNIRFFAGHSVRSLFSQCNREIGGEFAELRGYLLSKLIWDPGCDERAEMIDFLDGYYGPAGADILRYIDELHQANHACGRPLGIFQGPLQAKNTYLTLPLFDRYMALFDRAQAAVAGDETLSARVRTARMPLWYAGLVLRYHSREERLSWAAAFAAAARQQGLERVEEWKITVETFLTDILSQLGSDRFVFGRESRGAFSALGSTGEGEPMDVFTRTQSSLNPVARFLDLPPSSAYDYLIYTRKEGELTFAGPGLKAEPERIPEGLERVDFPAADYVTMTCEAADIPEAEKPLADYLNRNGLVRSGEPFCIARMRGLPTLYYPVKAR